LRRVEFTNEEVELLLTMTDNWVEGELDALEQITKDCTGEEELLLLGASSLNNAKVARGIKGKLSG
jgi:hypothetical protein